MIKQVGLPLQHVTVMFDGEDCEDHGFCPFFGQNRCVFPRALDVLTLQSLHCCCQDLSIPEVKVIMKDADVKDGVPLSLASDSASDAQQTTATRICLNLAVSWCFLKGRVEFGGEPMILSRHQ